ncbi:MAG: hypothetical protein IJW94_04530 [Oscillospiraceae bacterium]|nr:hypothetical protein [Oscillospiraceae bacterium]
MKNRRNVVIALLLIAVLCVGIGYAALNDTIDFTGKISYTPDFQIVWGTATDLDSILTNSEGTDTDKFTVSMNTSEWVVGETKTFTVTVKNASRYDAENVAVKALTTTAVEDNYTVTAEVTGAYTIAVGGTTTVTVTVTMDSYPTDTVTNAEFTFQVYADQVA